MVGALVTWGRGPALPDLYTSSHHRQLSGGGALSSAPTDTHTAPPTRAGGQKGNNRAEGTNGATKTPRETSPKKGVKAHTNSAACQNTTNDDPPASSELRFTRPGVSGRWFTRDLRRTQQVDEDSPDPAATNEPPVPYTHPTLPTHVTV